MSKVDNYEVLETYSNSNSLTIDQVMSEINNWDPNTVEEFSGHTSDVWCLTTTSSNSHLFSAGQDNAIFIWLTETGQVQSRLTGHSNTINILELTLNDEILISGCWNGQIFKWDWKACLKTGEFLGSEGGVYCSLIFKQVLITGGGDTFVRIWKIDDCSMVSKMRVGQDSVFGLALFYHQSQFLVSGDFNGMLNVWHLKDDFSLNHMKKYSPNQGSIQCIASTPNSLKLIAGTRENVLMIFDLPQFELKDCLKNHTNWVRSLSVSLDSKFFFSASADKTVKFFSLDDFMERFSYNLDEGYLFCVHLVKDQSCFYTSGSGKVIKKRKLMNFNKFKKLVGHQNAVLCLFLCPDPTVVVSASQDGVIKVWDLVGMREIRSIQAHSGAVWSVCLTNNMKYLLSAGSDCLVQVWDYYQLTLEKKILAHQNEVYALSTSNNSFHFASGGKDKKLILYSYENFQQIHEFEGHTDTIFSIKFSNNFLFSGSADYTVRIWDLNSLSLFKRINVKTGIVETLSITKDLTTIFIGDRSGTLTLWDLERGAVKEVIKVHKGLLKSISLSPDDSLIITGGSDKKTNIINVNEKVMESTFFVHKGSVRCVGITSDLKYIVTGSEDCTLLVWNRSDSSTFRVNSFYSAFDSFFFLQHLNQNIVPNHELCSMSISPLKLTFGHIYAYNGNFKLLELALHNGLDLRKDYLGNSPLHYALNRKIQPSIDVIIKFLVEIKSFEKFLNLVWSIRSDFERILGNISTFLPDFMEKVLYPSSQKHLKKFGIPKQKLPILIFKSENFIEINDFLQDLEDISQEVLVEFRVLPFPVSIETGSESSISMLKSILNNKNKLVIRSRVVTLIVKSRWDNFWYFITFISIIYWANISIMIVLLVHDTRNVAALVIYGIMNFLLFIYEIMQLIAIGFKEYLNFWNFIDQARIFLCFSWIILAASIGEEKVIWLSYIMVIFNFLRGLSGFRIFKNTRFYTTLILRSSIQIIPFLMIFFYTTLFFGVLSWTASNDRNSAFDGVWKKAFELNMGNFENNSEFDFEFIYFMFGSILNVIIVLNLLISILGDTYDNFQEQSVELGNLEMVEIVLEIETLMIWKRKRNQKGYLQVCQYSVNEGLSDNWEGKIKAIQSIIKKDTKNVNAHFEYIKNSIDRIEEIVNNNLH